MKIFFYESPNDPINYRTYLDKLNIESDGEIIIIKDDFLSNPLPTSYKYRNIYRQILSDKFILYDVFVYEDCNGKFGILQFANIFKYI